VQRGALTQPLADFERGYARNEAIAEAYLLGHPTMAALAQHFGVHYTTVSRLVGKHENAAKVKE
jgi:transposase